MIHDLKTADKAHAHVTSMVPEADIKTPFPAWHGWALREAYLAGYAERVKEEREKTNAEQTT